MRGSFVPDPQFPSTPSRALSHPSWTATQLPSGKLTESENAQPSVAKLAAQMMGKIPSLPKPVLSASTLPEIENAAQALAHDTPLPPPIIPGILDRGAKGVIGGSSKSYKTWILSDLAISVATGRDWLGFPTVQGRVLYLNLEIQPGYFNKRLKHICEAKEICPSSLESLSLWNLRGYAADILELGPQIIETIKDEDYSLLILDPIYKAMGNRDENKAGDIASLLNELDRVAVQTGAAVMFGAHFSKGNQAGKESIDRIGGSGVFARDPDTLLIVTKHEHDNAYTVESTLRNHQHVDPFVIKFEFPLMVRDGELDPNRLRTPGRQGKKYLPDPLLALLGDQELARGEWLFIAKSQLGLAETTFNRLRDELLEGGKIEILPGKKYRRVAAQSTPPTATPNKGTPQGEGLIKEVPLEVAV